MWLIDVHTMKLQYFMEVDPDICEYAILSHTWGSEEVSFQEMVSLEPGAEIQKQGFHKIKKTCIQAKAEGYAFAWVDTCCIDKSSSAEVSEAINSMFRWYAQARVCYVFMSDVSEEKAFDDTEPEFPKSRWFTRGWTLQELLAPQAVFFFSKEWKRVGSKSELTELLHKITRIDQEVLTGERDLQAVPIARRMSWAADRRTTRTEDLAYCLLGIFDVNTTMIYGEGHKAFGRLQEEILRATDDHTIFAWTDPTASDTEERGLLAPHPRCFKNSGGFQPIQARKRIWLKVELTNLGVRLFSRLDVDSSGRRRAMLNCIESEHISSFPFIYLNNASEYYTARTHVSQLGIGTSHGDPAPISVLQDPRKAMYHRSRASKFFSVALELPKSCSLDQMWISSQSDIRSHSGSNKQLVTASGMQLNHWNLIQGVSDISQYVYGYSELGTVTLAIQLSAEKDVILGCKQGGICIIVGTSQDGRLGADLTDLQFISESKLHSGARFHGQTCPGLTYEVKTLSGRGYKLSFSESSPALGQSKEIQLQLREAETE